MKAKLSFQVLLLMENVENVNLYNIRCRKQNHNFQNNTLLGSKSLPFIKQIGAKSQPFKNTLWKKTIPTKDIYNFEVLPQVSGIFDIAFAGLWTYF